MTAVSEATANYGRDEAAAVIRWYRDILEDGETTEYAEIGAAQSVRHCRGFLPDDDAGWPQFVAHLTASGYSRWLVLS